MFKVGQRVRVARDNSESRFVCTGATGVVAAIEVGDMPYIVMVRVDSAWFLPSGAIGWEDPLWVAVPFCALEKLNGLFDI